MTQSGPRGRRDINKEAGYTHAHTHTHTHTVLKSTIRESRAEQRWHGHNMREWRSERSVRRRKKRTKSVMKGVTQPCVRVDMKALDMDT